MIFGNYGNNVYDVIKKNERRSGRMKGWKDID